MLKAGQNLVFVLLLVSVGYAQDPGIPDTVSFGPWEAIVPVDSPWTGNIRVPVRVFNDEPLVAVSLVFKWSGPFTAQEVRFAGKWADSFDLVRLSIDSLLKQVILFGTIYSVAIAPDSGVLAYLCFTVQDTGQVAVDTTATLFMEETSFLDEVSNLIKPQIKPLVDTVQETNLFAGDVNLDSTVNLADIIYLANFIFKGALKPQILALADVNSDCRVDVVDMVYLVNVVLRSNFTPRWGCVC